MNRQLKIKLILLVCILIHTSIFAESKYDSLVRLTKSNPAKLIKLIGQNNNQLNSVKASYLLASANQNLGNYFKTDSILESSFSKYSFKKDSTLYIQFLILDAENKKVMDQFEDALSILVRIQSYYKKRNDKFGQLESALLFAEYYRAADNYDLALNYINKANSIGNSIDAGFPVLLKARMLNRKAAIYLEQAIHLDSVELFSKEVIKIANIAKDYNQVATSSNELGFLYLNLGNKEAEKYFANAISIWDGMGYNIYANNARENLARWYLISHQENRAIKLANESLAIVYKYNWAWEQGYWYEILAKAYRMKGNYQLSSEYMEKAKDQLLNNARNQYKEKVAFYANKLDLKEKQEEISKKNFELDVKSKENTSLLLSLIGLGIVLLGAIVGILIISRQKKLLAKQKEEINTINHNLEKLVAQKEILLKEVNHRVKNNLSLLSGLMYLKSKELNGDESIQAMLEIQTRVHTISLIHESLYQRDDFENVNFQEYLSKLTEHLLQFYPSHKKIQLLLSCENFNPELSIAISLAMMINELITNSIKYAFENVEEPKISIVYNNESKILLYSDNGPGYEVDNTKVSLGSNLLNIFAKQINATIHFEKNDNLLSVKIDLANSSIL